jgi:hypothetical protein
MPLKKQTVKCPDCKEQDVEIFTGEDGKGICLKCGCDVEAVHRHAHYTKLAKTVSESEPEPEPEPEPKPPKKKKDDPFSFRM